MQVVCEATQCQDTRVSVAALECLVKIMSLYYTYMEVYMPSALFAVCNVLFDDNFTITNLDHSGIYEEQR